MKVSTRVVTCYQTCWCHAKRLKLNGKPGRRAEDLNDHKHAQVRSFSVHAICLAIRPLWQNTPPIQLLAQRHAYSSKLICVVDG